MFETREKQLKLWRELIIDFCMRNKLHSIVPSQFPHFHNPAIDRHLPPAGIDAVVESLINAGNAEWEDGLRTNLRIVWKSPSVLAAEIYGWAVQAGEIGTVFTIYELHSGEDTQDSGFHGSDPVLVRRAVELLQQAKKVRVESVVLYNCIYANQLVLKRKLDYRPARSVYRLAQQEECS